MVGTTAAIIAMIAGSAAGSIASAGIAAHGATSAAQQQQQSAADALNFLKQVWGQQLQLEQPYLNYGNQSVSLLGSLMLPPGAPGAYKPPGSVGAYGGAGSAVMSNLLGTPTSTAMPSGPMSNNPMLGNAMLGRTM